MSEARPHDAVFRPEFFDFLRDLARHNDRAWFQAHRDRYESSVQAPALAFIRKVGPGLSRVSRHVVADPRTFGGSLFRIYRDTRFSRDKSPYKTNVGLHFFHDQAEGKKEHLPGFYLHLGPGENVAFSGMWRPEAAALEQIRPAIAKPSSSWSTLRRSGILTDGEQFARVPKGFPSTHRFADDLRRKDFFAKEEFSEEQVTAPDFGQQFVAACRKLGPLNRFLCRAMDFDW